MKLKIIFLDRDGVINKDTGYLHRIQDFEFIDGVLQTCQYINSKGYKIIIVTNQSGIGRGLYSEEDFSTLNEWMISEFENFGVKILNVYHCPHTPEDNCMCRKPKSGMLNLAFDQIDIDKKNSWMIGDKEDDIIAASGAGLENTVLVRSGQKINETLTKAKYIVDSIKDITEIIS